MSSLSQTSISNMALARIGAAQITDFTTSTSVPGQQVRLHYEQVKNSLLRAHEWGFAGARASLAALATDPIFEWSSQYPLPVNFLKLRSIFQETGTFKDNAVFSYTIEGNNILTNADAPLKIRYTKIVTDPMEFDALFTEVLILSLATKLISVLAENGSPALLRELLAERKVLMTEARTTASNENRGFGREDNGIWLNARLHRNGGRILSQLGS